MCASGKNEICVSLALKVSMLCKTQQLSGAHTDKQGDTDAYLYNVLKHMGERQERDQSIIWGSSECTLKARTPARRKELRLPGYPHFPPEQGTWPLNTQHNRFLLMSLFFSHQRIKSNFKKKNSIIGDGTRALHKLGLYPHLKATPSRADVIRHN